MQKYGTEVPLRFQKERKSSRFLVLVCIQIEFQFSENIRKSTCLTGSLQGRIDLQGVPCKPCRVWVCSAYVHTGAIPANEDNFPPTSSHHLKKTLIFQF